MKDHIKARLLIAVWTVVVIGAILVATARADNYGTTKAESDRSIQQIYGVFGRGYAGRCMVRIMWRESGGNPRAANYHDWYGGSYGLLQLNAVHRWRTESMAEFRARMWNPRTHLIAAKRLYDGSGFRAWGGCPS